MDLRRAVCVMSCEYGHNHGKVILKEIYENGPVEILLYINGIDPGKHGFHVHRNGNTVCGADSLCDHFNPTGNTHGGLNDPNSHFGDLGNVVANSTGNVRTSIVADFIRLRGPLSVIGRSLIIHEDEDDLGRGGYSDSLTTGHSGKRLLWGVIGIDEWCG